MTEIEMQMLQAMREIQKERQSLLQTLEHFRQQYSEKERREAEAKENMRNLLQTVLKEYESAKAETEKLGAQVELLNKQLQLFTKQLNALGE